MKEKDENLVKHYFPLLAVLVFGFFAFIIFPFDKAFQLFITGLVGVLYIVWGILHHRMHGDLQIKTVLEYVLIALLGILIVYSVILRA